MHNLILLQAAHQTTTTSTTVQHGAPSATPHGETVATTEAHGGAAEHHPDPTAFGLNATNFVSLAMLVLLGIALWKGAGRAIANMLDGKIATIKSQLDEAATLRAEAEALKAEYAAKLKSAEGEVVDIRRRAEDEAKAIVAKAETDTSDMIARRQKMAEDRIGAAEREAIAGVRAQAAAVARDAAAGIIAARNDAGNDRRLVDATIRTLGNA